MEIKRNKVRKGIALAASLIIAGTWCLRLESIETVHAKSVKNETSKVALGGQKQASLPVITYEGTASKNPTFDPETNTSNASYGLPKDWQVGFTADVNLGLDAMPLKFEGGQEIDLTAPAKVYALQNNGRIQYVPGGGINLGTFGDTAKRFGIYQNMEIDPNGGRFLIGVSPSYAIDMIKENDNYTDLIKGGNTFSAYTSFITPDAAGKRELIESTNLGAYSGDASFKAYLSEDAFDKVKSDGKVTIGYEVGSNSTTLQKSGAAFLKDFQVFQADMFQEVQLPEYFPIGVNLDDCVTLENIQNLVENAEIQYADATGEKKLTKADFEDEKISFDGFFNENLQIDYCSGVTNNKNKGYFWGQISGNYQREKIIGIVKITYYSNESYASNNASTTYGGPYNGALNDYFEDVYSYLNFKGKDTTEKAPSSNTNNGYTFGSRSALGISFVRPKDTNELYMNLFYGSGANHVLPFNPDAKEGDAEFLAVAVYHRPENGANTISEKRTPDEEIVFDSNQVPADYRTFGRNGTISVKEGDIVKIQVGNTADFGFNSVSVPSSIASPLNLTTDQIKALIKPKEYFFMVTANKKILSFSGVNQFLPKKDPVELQLLTTDLTQDSISSIFNYWSADNKQFKQPNGTTTIDDTSQSYFLDTKGTLGVEKEFPYYGFSESDNKEPIYPPIYPTGVAASDNVKLTAGVETEITGQMTQKFKSQSGEMDQAEELEVNYQIPFKVTPSLRPNPNNFAYPWSFLSSNWLDYDTSSIPASSSFFMTRTNRSKVTGWSKGVKLVKDDKEPLGVRITQQGYELKANYGTQPDDWQNVEEAVAVEPSKGEPNLEEWVQISNIGFYEGRSLDLKITLYFKSEIPYNGYPTANYQQKWWFDLGSANFGRTMIFNQYDEHVGYSFTDSQTGEPVVVSGFMTSDTLGYNSMKILKEDVLNFMSYGRTAVPKTYNTISTKYTYPDNSMDITTTDATGTFLEFGSKAKRPDTYYYQGYNAQGTVMFAKKDEWSIYPTKVGSGTKGNNYQIAIISKAPTRVDIPAPGDQEQVIDTIEEDTTIDYGFVQMIPNQEAKYRNRKMKWTWEDAVYSGEGPSPFDVGQYWEITDQDGVDVVTNDDETKNYFDWVTDDNGKTIGAELKDPTKAAFYGKMYYFKRKLVFNGQEVNLNDLAEDSKGHKYLSYTDGKVKLEVENQGEYENNFSTKVNFAGEVSYYAFTDTNPPKPIEAVGVNSDNGLVNQSTPTILTHPYPADVEVPGFAGFRLVRQSPTQLNPTVQVTNTVINGYYENAPVSAKAKPQIYLLGDSITPLTPEVLHDWVSDVKIEKEPNFDVTEYTVKWGSPATPQVVKNIDEDNTITVEITAEGPNGSVSGKLTIPVTVSMGNSIVVGGSTTNLASRESTMAYTLHKDADDQYYITATYGKLPSDKLKTPLGINYQLQKIAMVQEPGKENAVIVQNGPEETTLNNLLLNATDTQTPESMLNSWNQKVSKGRLSVNLGDIIWLYVSDENQKALYTDNKGPNPEWQNLTDDDNTLLAVVTEDGFEPLYVNHLTPRDNIAITPAQSENQAAYDKFYNQSPLNKFFIYETALAAEFSKVHADGFVLGPTGNETANYPNNAGPIQDNEEFSGKVFAAQSNGVNDKWVKTAYSLTFVGSSPQAVIFNGVPPGLMFGTQKIKMGKQTVNYSTAIIGEDRNYTINVLNGPLSTDWSLQASLAVPFATDPKDGTGAKELKGAYLQFTRGSVSKKLEPGMTGSETLYEPNEAVADNEISYDGMTNKVELIVLPTAIKAGDAYQATVEYKLVNGPED